MTCYTTDTARWAAVQSRTPAADGAFVYCVRTTKIFCRPICKARLARRDNVVFHDTPRAAVHAGFRACRRCRPEQEGNMPDEEAVQKIRAFVSAHAADAHARERLGTLRQMAAQTGLSRWHFHRVFKRVVGVTPREWVSQRSNVGGEEIGDAEKRLEGDGAGEGSVVALTESELDALDAFDWGAWTPSSLEVHSLGGSELFLDELSNGSEGLEKQNGVLSEYPVVHYTIRSASFGLLLLAYQGQRVCFVHQGHKEADLVAALDEAFPPFLYRHVLLDRDGGGGVPGVEKHAAALLELMESPSSL